MLLARFQPSLSRRRGTPSLTDSGTLCRLSSPACSPPVNQYRDKKTTVYPRHVNTSSRSRAPLANSVLSPLARGTPRLVGVRGEIRRFIRQARKRAGRSQTGCDSVHPAGGEHLGLDSYFGEYFFGFILAFGAGNTCNDFARRHKTLFILRRGEHEPEPSARNSSVARGLSRWRGETQ
ncbi:hypothetical protein KCP70_05935 [Salmonella enterica subsp. enterica]|nr:hypothetical protein KCP70_05935 [Salmonella enterica subsp. enterica]